MKPYRKTWAEINLDAISHNISTFKEWLPPSTDIMAVVKADAYGHGALTIAQEALASGAKWLGVALLEEALELRQSGIKVPILVFGYLPPEEVPISQENDISITVTDADFFEDMLTAINPAFQPLKFHLKVDTGMGRLGITKEEELQGIIKEYNCHEQISEQNSLVWEGIYTHLATADEEDESYFQEQKATFEQFLQIVKEQGLSIPYIHLANSAGTFKHKQFPYMNLVRLGISMYGLYPSLHMKKDLPFSLEEAFSLHAQLSLIKKVAAHAGISYGKTYLTSTEEWVGTLPIGYADGWRRNLSNRAEVLVDGRRRKIIGRICMDQTIIQLDKWYPRNEKATLIGEQKEGHITVDEVAQLLETINYEVPCMIGKRVPRIYKKNSCKNER